MQNRSHPVFQPVWSAVESMNKNLDSIGREIIAAFDSAGEGAPDADAMAATPAEHDGRGRSSKRQRKDATESDQADAATPGQAQHVKAASSTRAKTCAPLP
jgi:hypothetical protein